MGHWVAFYYIRSYVRASRILLKMPKISKISATKNLSNQKSVLVWESTTKKNSTIQNKIIGAYYPQEFNPESGDFNSGNERHNTHQIIDINFSYKILENLIIGGGSHNFNNYTNAQYGPFIGRTYYIQLTTQEKGT